MDNELYLITITNKFDSHEMCYIWYAVKPTNQSTKPLGLVDCSNNLNYHNFITRITLSSY